MDVRFEAADGRTASLFDMVSCFSGIPVGSFIGLSTSSLSATAPAATWHIVISKMSTQNMLASFSIGIESTERIGHFPIIGEQKSFLTYINILRL